jgi:molybdate transport system permease protein
MKRAIGYGLFVAVAVLTLAFLLLPIVGIFVHTSPGKVLGQLSNPVVKDAFIVTLKTSLIAQALIVLFGTPTAYLLATHRFVGRSFAITLVELPLVLPPAVAGVGLLAALGREGLLGSSLSALGVTLPFTQSAVTVAVAYVASPLYIRQAIASFEATDPHLTAASRTLGAGPVRTFFRVVLPLARAGLIAGLALSFARGLGEFGATIMFAGNMAGRTQTLPLVVYSEFQGGDLDASIAAAAILVLAAFGVLVAVRVFHWGRVLDTRGLT